MAVLPHDRRHLVVAPPSEGNAYRRPGGGGDKTEHPQRNRTSHATHLLHRTGEAIAQGEAWMQAREPDVAEGDAGFYLAFSMPEKEAAFIDNVGDGRRKVELVAVQRPADGDTVLGTVFVPQRSADYFSRKVEAYGDPDNDTRNAHGEVTGYRNERLVSRVLDVAIGSARSIFTDEVGDFPAANRRVWWEVWVRDGRVDRVGNVARKLGLDVRPQVLSFPERDIVLVFGGENEINRLIRNSDGVAELRLASDTPALFIDMPPCEQPEWADALMQHVEPPSAESPFVTILDSGANREHPLISSALADNDQFTVKRAWGVGDSLKWSGHGTAMAGAVLFPDLDASLASAGGVELTHRLETVKILPHDGSDNDRMLYGAITEASVKQVEAANPARLRVFCMAVSSQFQMQRGRPSSWSAAVDKLAFEGPEGGRVFVVAAGNIGGDILARDYPARNDIEPVESPGQAWNALVVGGYTQRTTLTDRDYAGWSAVAPVGALAPTTRTGVPWDREWANRPDIVFEAGNLAHDGANPGDRAPDLQLVTTHYRPQLRLFESFGDTSAATAQAANLCGQLRANYPALRPETIRGLVVHSAVWTPHMAAEMDAARTAIDRTAILRRYGWGVPDRGRAMRSAANDATVIVEGQIVPYDEDAKLNELHLHRLPWPREELEDLGDVPVDLRVTLSYFVEPNPADRGWTRRHRYASHALRFKVKQPSETEDQFHQRINASAEFDVDPERSPSDDDRWLLKEGVRDRGSLHSDIWRGTAADLAERHVMAVFPVGGWWKEKKKLGRCGKAVTYSLIISITTEAEIDLHTAISNQIAVEMPAK